MARTLRRDEGRSIREIVQSIYGAIQHYAGIERLSGWTAAYHPSRPCSSMARAAAF
jgi:hypothetical protein